MIALWQYSYSVLNKNGHIRMATTGGRGDGIMEMFGVLKSMVIPIREYPS